MKATIIVLLGISLLFGCNKTQRNAKRLDGTWTIYSYAQITSGGFLQYYTADGTITFEDSGDGNLSFEDDFTYFTPTDTITSKRAGTIVLGGEEGLEIDLSLTSPNGVFVDNETIHLLNRDDLKIEFRQNGTGHLFVLQKN